MPFVSSHSIPQPCVVPLLVLLVAPLVGCSSEGEADPRFSTPEATLETLLDSYGVARMTQEEIQQHMRSRGRFQLRDEETYKACFSDYDSVVDEGLAGFVFGTVAAGKDELRIHAVQGKAHVYPDPERRDRSVVLVEENGAWRISLRESVPAEIRRRLVGEYERISARNRRAGAPD